MYTPHSATAVLPQPTSPCSNLFMRCGPPQSAEISATALFCPSVKGKGKREMKAAMSSFVHE